MAAMIWDEQSQAWKEAETPLVYDAASGALIDTAGMTFDAEAQAWEEAWGPKKILYLYNNGDECTDVTGGWKYQPYNYYSSSFVSKEPTIERRVDSLYTRLVFNRSFDCALIGTANIINISKYTKMYCEVSGRCSANGSHWGEINIFDGGYKYNYTDIKSVAVCSSTENGKYFRSSDHTLYEINITDIGNAAFAIEHVCDAYHAPDFVQLFKLWLE